MADADETVRRALRALLTQGLGMRVAGEAATTEDLQRQVTEFQPDLVIVAWNLLAPEAAAALATMRTSSPGLRIVALALRPDTRAAALSAGADDFICKVDPPEQVLRVLQRRDGNAGAADHSVQPGTDGSAGTETDREGGRP